MTRGDRYFKNSAGLSAILLILLFAGTLSVLVQHSHTAIEKFGLKFLTSDEWNPVMEVFGAWSSIQGTLISSVLALIIAVPISFGIAFCVTEIAPGALRHIIARLIELMAGIPSIIYGMWGLFVLVPVMSLHVEPWLLNVCDGIPVLGTLFGGAPTGVGMLTAGLILALMIIPLISSVMRDVLLTVPTPLKEAAYGVSSTRWEMIRYIILPQTRIGLLGAVILGFGRALGETMAVTFVIGNSHMVSKSLFMPSTTISATIANEFSEATGEAYRSALMELGLILFIITFIILAASRFLLKLTQQRQS